MMWLNDESLFCAVHRCEDRESYRVGIAVPIVNEAHDAFDKVMELIDKPLEINKIISTNLHYEVRFNNGSSILIFTGNETVEGQTFNLLVVDRHINKKKLDCDLLQRELPNWMQGVD